MHYYENVWKLFHFDGQHFSTSRAKGDQLGGFGQYFHATVLHLKINQKKRPRPLSSVYPKKSIRGETCPRCRALCRQNGCVKAWTDPVYVNILYNNNTKAQENMYQ